MKISRRIFLKVTAFFLGIFTLPFVRKVFPVGENKVAFASNKPSEKTVPGPGYNLGVANDGISRVYLAKNASAEENMHKAMELMGGIERYIGTDDIVVLKPNAQWWNQGMTNTDSMKAFIEMVLDIPGFSGEIIIAENHQAQQDNNWGWNTEHRNGNYNYNELVTYFQGRGYANVTKYHWHNGGTCLMPLQMDGCCGTLVNGPEDGDGYVWEKNNSYVSPQGRECPMSYPIFTSAYSGIRVDLKNGAWKDGRYISNSVKLVNFSALNHHTAYAGVTASIKNLMGVVDMTCGFPGEEPENTFNVHHIGVDKKIKWLRYNPKVHWRLEGLNKTMRKKFDVYCHRHFSHTGGALGHFMAHVKFPSLNIITADWVGWGARVDTKKSFNPRALLASLDPVALDYTAAKEILLPGTPVDAKAYLLDEKLIDLHNPDKKEGPFYKFLLETHQQGIGNIESSKIEIVSHGV